ncbi:fungal pheromone STE3G-protein-coupled receptor, partial [Rhizodiscina lignyota]
PLYPLAVILPILAIIAILLDLPPLIWHLRHRNVGAASLIIYLTVLNLVTFTNVLIWPRDNVTEWFQGAVFCDIEVRLYLMGALGGSAATICIFRELARVLDTNATVISTSKIEKRRKLVLELLLCYGAPLFFILVFYVVQAGRYAILGITGCVYVIADSWLSIVLTVMWFPIFDLIAAIYACIVIYRLIRYSRDFSTLIRSHSSTRSRFWRTFILCLLIICSQLPANLYAFSLAFPVSTGPFSWSYTHSEWDIIYLYPSHGKVRPETFGSIIAGWLVFFFFGTGTEALKMYRGWLATLGLGKIWPSL